MNTFIEIKPTYDFTDFFHFAKKKWPLILSGETP